MTPFRVGDHWREPAATDPVAGLLDELHRCVVGDLDEEEAGVAQGKRVLQMLGKEFVEVVLPSGKEGKVDLVGFEPGLEVGDGFPDREVVRIVAPPDQVRRAIDRGETGIPQRRGHLHRFGHGGRAVVQAGQQMTMPICCQVLSFEF